MSRILVWHDNRFSNTDESKQFLKEHFPNEEIFVTADEQEAIKNVADTEILLATLYSRELLEKGVNIKWIQGLSAGYNHHDMDYIRSRGIKFCKIFDVHNKHMAEFAMMAMIMLVREMNVMAEAQHDKHWRLEFKQERIYGKTLVVLGCGAIGITMAEYAKAMGMHIVAVNRKRLETSDTLDECYTMEELESVLPKADIVLSMLPSSPETHHLMTKEKFSLMKKSAYFINMGRGDLVASEVLYDVLSNGIIKGAFIDVAEVEPLSSDSPLWSLKNIIITPHSSGYYHNYLLGSFQSFYRNYELYQKCEELLFRVDNI